MKWTRKILVFTLLVLAALFIQSSAAAYANAILPDSSHYQGTVHYNLIGGRIDFAVYDTDTPNGQAFEDVFGTAPGTGQFIYTYQIFTDDTSEALEYFAVLGIGENALVSPVNDNIGSLDDLTGEGVAPDEYPYIGSSSMYGTMGIWEFTDNLLDAGQHSWFLVLRSPHDWIPGGFTFNKSLANETPVPNPEPSTLALLGLGCVVLLRRKRRSV